MQPGKGFLTFIPCKGFKISQLSVGEGHHPFTFRRAIEMAVVSEIMTGSMMKTSSG
jgi:DNA-binding GntR family transcriptional regulator